MTEYAILNTERNRFLTSTSGRGIWDSKHRAKHVLDREFGSEEHLTVVRVER